jgi:hypothetical protein
MRAYTGWIHKTGYDAGISMQSLDFMTAKVAAGSGPDYPRN